MAHKETKIYILVNPGSRSGNRSKILKQMEMIFAGEGYSPVILESRGKGGMEELARRITDGEDETVLIIAGGDGSVNEVLNGVCNLDRVILGVVPAGSSNDFCRDIGASDPLAAAVRIARNLKEGERIVRDIGLVRYRDLSDGKMKERRFNVSAGIGFDAEVCVQADRSRAKKLLNVLGLGKLAYITAAVRMILTSRGGHFRITIGGKQPQKLHVRNTLFAACMNHRFEGGGFMFCPGARADDGRLDICIPSGITRLSFFRLFPLAYKGKHAGHKNVILHQADQFVIEARTPQYFHTDGEVFAKTTRLEAEILPGAVRFLL